MLLSLVEHFRTVEDPRLGQNKRHKLLDIIVLSICAVAGLAHMVM